MYVNQSIVIVPTLKIWLSTAGCRVKPLAVVVVVKVVFGRYYKPDVHQQTNQQTNSTLLHQKKLLLLIDQQNSEWVYRLTPVAVLLQRQKPLELVCCCLSVVVVVFWRLLILGSFNSIQIIQSKEPSRESVVSRKKSQRQPSIALFSFSKPPALSFSKRQIYCMQAHTTTGLIGCELTYQSLQHEDVYKKKTVRLEIQGLSFDCSEI